MEAAYDRAKSILIENRDKMDSIVKILLEKETLEREEFEALMEGASINPCPAKETSSEQVAGESVEPKVVDGAEELADRKKETKPRLEPGVA